MAKQILVMGLGTFGGQVARELAALGHEVLGCDRDMTVVATIAPDITSAMELDATDAEALKAVGPTEFDLAVVALDRPATIFTTMLLEQLGMRSIVARAASSLDEEILRRVGADRVVMPDRLMATWVARTIDLAGALDYIRLSNRVAAVHLRAPSRTVGQTIETVVRAGPGLGIVALHRGDDVVVGPALSTVLEEGDGLLVVGPEEGFRALGG
jgi:trk system potassium uptake protein TrkA